MMDHDTINAVIEILKLDRLNVDHQSIYRMLTEWDLVTTIFDSVCHTCDRVTPLSGDRVIYFDSWGSIDHIDLLHDEYRVLTESAYCVLGNYEDVMRYRDMAIKLNFPKDGKWIQFDETESMMMEIREILDKEIDKLLNIRTFTDTVRESEYLFGEHTVPPFLCEGNGVDQ